jgi:peptidoglycan/xylan/chitin deacetylase (PgdA/CDA1 family)
MSLAFRAVGGVAAAGACLAYAVRAPGSSLIAPSISRGPRHRKAIALTFDDGPSASTPAVLEILGSFGVKATFFQCGAHVRRLPDVALAVARAGHEIGNHTYTHSHLWLRSQRFIEIELEQTQIAVERVTGQHPRYFRAPYGVRWFGLRKAQHMLGLMGVMWTVIGLDWKLKAPAILDRVLSGAGNGGIICLHDGRGMQEQPDITSTIEATRKLVPELLSQGYELRTVSELVCPTN